LLIISSFFIRCTETGDREKDDCPPQVKQEIATVVDSSILKYACVLSLLEEKREVTDKHLSTFLNWFNNNMSDIL